MYCIFCELHKTAREEASQTFYNLNLVDIVTTDHASLKEITPACIKQQQ